MTAEVKMNHASKPPRPEPVDIAPYFDKDYEGETFTACPACPAGAGSGAAKYEELWPEVWRKMPCDYCQGEGLVTASRRAAWLSATEVDLAELEVLR